MNRLEVLVECSLACNIENLLLNCDFLNSVNETYMSRCENIPGIAHWKKLSWIKITGTAHKTHAFDFSWTSFRCSIINLFSLNGFWQTVHWMYCDGSISWCVFSWLSRLPLLLNSFPQIRQMNFSRGLKRKICKFLSSINRNSTYFDGWTEFKWFLISCLVFDRWPHKSQTNRFSWGMSEWRKYSCFFR